MSNERRFTPYAERAPRVLRAGLEFFKCGDLPKLERNLAPCHDYFIEVLDGRVYLCWTDAEAGISLIFYSPPPTPA
jgi:hypothetical protein